MMRYSIKISRTDSKKLKLFLVLFALIIATISTFYYYHQAQVVRSFLKSPFIGSEKGAVADQEVKRIVELVGGHILLPSENPTVYVVSDPSQVGASYGEFFKGSLKGDYLLLYTERAIIYREKEDIIVNVGPIAVMPLKSD